MLSHWQTLTQFLRVPGAPLDNNTAERALKLIIRQRKNSLFYHNDFSAYVFFTPVLPKWNHRAVPQ